MENTMDITARIDGLSSAADTIWVLLAAILIFMMQMGFASVEAGFTRSKNTANILMKNLLDFCFGALLFWLLGFRLMFGADAFAGLLANPFAPSASIPDNIPQTAFLIFQTMFCATTAYTMQNLASGMEQLAKLLVFETPVPASESVSELCTVAITVVVYAACYLGFIRRIDGLALERMQSRVMLAVFVVVAFAVIGFDLLVKSIYGGGVSFTHVVLLRAAHALICVFVLISEYEILCVQQLRADKLSIERMLTERGRQYEMARDNIEAINIKCHDIKHQIRTLSSGGRVADQSALDDLAHEVAIYDSAIETGNEALDTILTEKSLICEHAHITLSCIVDGASLDFVAPSDLYAFFGNALDNAIEAVSALENDERRSISLVVKRRGSMVSIHAENFFDGRLTFFGGLPRTTKADVANHGFGIKSMRLIAEKYEGSLTTSAENGIFRLDAVIPRPRTT